MRLVNGLLAAAGLVLANPAVARDVKASDPSSIIAALGEAGFAGELATDDTGDPMVNTKLGAWTARILFYGCDETAHNNCKSVQFFTVFDAPAGVQPVEALRLNGNLRFLSVSLDQDNDPIVTWDMVLGEGVPSSVFGEAARSYAGALDGVAESIFPAPAP